MGILGQYAAGSKKVYDDVGSGPTRVYFDCEADYLVEIVDLKSGISENKKSNRMGQPYAAGSFRVIKIHSQGENAENSVIAEKTIVSWHVWLPRNEDPERMSLEEKFNLAEVIDLTSGILGLLPDYVDLNVSDQLFEDDGRRVVGRLLGVSVRESKGYFNPRFYPVDTDGKRIEALDPEGVKARNAAA